MGESGSPSEGRHVVIAGGSFAGLGAAFTAKQALGPSGRVTVIDPSGHFFFAPSLIWSALGQPLLNSSFALEPALASKDIEFVRASVREVRAEDHALRTDEDEITYDRLIVATGGQPSAHAIPGLAGEFRAASWVVGEDSAMEARTMLRRFFDNPGPLVVGAAQGASYISAAYELALGLDAELRRKQLRNRVPITFVTAEPYLGQLGFGQSAAGPKLAKAFADRSISTRIAVDIEAIDGKEVRLSSGESLPAQASIIMPPMTGAVDIWKSAELTDETGLIPVDARYQSTLQPHTYAAGVASYFTQPVAPLPTGRAPHTGYLSLHMGQAAGQNAAASLGAGSEASRPLPFVVDVRVIDGIDAGLLLASWGNSKLSNAAFQLPGAAAHTLKASIERYLLWRLRNGRMDLP